MGPFVSISRDQGTATFSNGVNVEETTSTPAVNTVYGNSGPLAYCYVTGTILVTDYGVASVTSASTGVYEIILDNNWVGLPVVIATSLNNSADTEIISIWTWSIIKTIAYEVFISNNICDTAFNT